MKNQDPDHQVHTSRICSICSREQREVTSGILQVRRRYGRDPSGLKKAQPNLSDFWRARSTREFL